MHHRADPTAQDAYSTGATYTGGHTETVRWTPQAVTFYLDGKEIGSSTNASAIPATPMHRVLQTETQLTEHPATRQQTMSRSLGCRLFCGKLAKDLSAAAM
jgi:beta-glucanase (GH16 family)